MLEINVSSDHIRNGIKGKPDRCPVVLGARDAGFLLALVTYKKAYFDDKDYIVEEDTKTFIKCVDNFDTETVLNIYPNGFVAKFQEENSVIRPS